MATRKDGRPAASPVRARPRVCRALAGHPTYIAARAAVLELLHARQKPPALRAAE
jgi:hypothetical protein